VREFQEGLRWRNYDQAADHVHAAARVRFLETQSPQLPANHSYRFNRDWDYLAERLGGTP